jgi:hypothetical protein
MDEAKRAQAMAFEEQQRKFQAESQAAAEELRRKAAMAYVIPFS